MCRSLLTYNYKRVHTYEAYMKHTDYSATISVLVTHVGGTRWGSHINKECRAIRLRWLPQNCLHVTRNWVEINIREFGPNRVVYCRRLNLYVCFAARSTWRLAIYQMAILKQERKTSTNNFCNKDRMSYGIKGYHMSRERNVATENMTKRTHLFKCDVIRSLYCYGSPEQTVYWPRVYHSVSNVSVYWPRFNGVST